MFDPEIDASSLSVVVNRLKIMQLMLLYSLPIVQRIDAAIRPGWWF